MIELSFKRKFGYGVSLDEMSKEKFIESSLKSLRHALRYTSELPDDKLLELCVLYEWEK